MTELLLSFKLLIWCITQSCEPHTRLWAGPLKDGILKVHLLKLRVNKWFFGGYFHLSAPQNDLVITCFDILFLYPTFYVIKFVQSPVRIQYSVIQKLFITCAVIRVTQSVRPPVPGKLCLKILMSWSVSVQNGNSLPIIITVIAWCFRHTKQMFLSCYIKTSQPQLHYKITFCTCAHTQKYQLNGFVFMQTCIQSRTQIYKWEPGKMCD